MDTFNGQLKIMHSSQILYYASLNIGKLFASEYNCSGTSKYLSDALNFVTDFKNLFSMGLKTFDCSVSQ